MKSDSGFFVVWILILCLLNCPAVEAEDPFYEDVIPIMFPAHNAGLPVEVQKVCDRIYLVAQKQAHHLERVSRHAPPAQRKPGGQGACQG